MATFNLIRRGVFTSIATMFDPHLLRITLRSPILTTLGKVHHKSSDIFEIFTTHLLAEKKYKSKVNATSKNERKINCDKSLQMDTWTQLQIDHYLLIVIDCNDRKTLTEIIAQLLKLERLPSDAVFLRVLNFLCDDSDDSMATISKLIYLCQKTNITFYVNNVEFAPFLSQYMWKLGRFDDALHILNTIYATTNQKAKIAILRNYRTIIYDAIKHRDEKIVDKMEVNAESILLKYKDPTLISYVWIDCFFSWMFYNQKKANDLFQKYQEIRDTVSKNTAWITLRAIQQDNIDPIHRLIEICLASNMKNEVGICLAALFDYHHWRDDLRSCSEVMNTCLRLGVPVSKIQNQKLLDLLLKKKPKQRKVTKEVPASLFEFKF